MRQLWCVGFILLLIHMSVQQCSLSTGETQIEAVTRPYMHGEGPHWNDKEQALYFVDISGHGFHRYDPKSKTDNFITLNDTVGVAVPTENSNEFLVGLGRQVVQLSWDGMSKNYSVRKLAEVDEDKQGNRFNDGKVGPSGELWIGTMGEENPVGRVKLDQGSLFTMKTREKLIKYVSPVSISNGLAWAKNNSVMFYIDSPTRRIDAFDYDRKSGTLSRRRTFFDFETFNLTGVPDGMTIDDEDNLWVACWGGSQVIQVSGANGCLTRIIPIPAKKVTSVVFGDLDLRTLYVTTMRAGTSEEELLKQPLSGAVFAVRGLGVKGTVSRAASLK